MCLSTFQVIIHRSIQVMIRLHYGIGMSKLSLIFAFHLDDVYTSCKYFIHTAQYIDVAQGLRHRRASLRPVTSYELRHQGPHAESGLKTGAKPLLDAQ